MSVWQSYNSATSRIPELAGKSTPGHFVTICGEDGTSPLEEYQGDLDVNNEKDYSVLIAGPNDDFFADRLLGRNLMELLTLVISCTEIPRESHLNVGNTVKITIAFRR